jgi:hypothetical protein
VEANVESFPVEETALAEADPAELATEIATPMAKAVGVAKPADEVAAAATAAATTEEPPDPLPAKADIAAAAPCTADPATPPELIADATEATPTAVAAEDPELAATDPAAIAKDAPVGVEVSPSLVNNDTGYAFGLDDDECVGIRRCVRHRAAAVRLDSET